MTVSATLDAGGQSIFATAKVQFRATSASGIIRFELHPNLNITDVKTEQGAFPESRNVKRPARSTWRVQLPTPLRQIQKLLL